MRHNVFKDLKVKCDICGLTRPEDKIDVRKIDFSGAAGLPEGCATENVRYCNDMDMCQELAMKKESRFVTAQKEKAAVSSGTSSGAVTKKKFTDKLDKAKLELEEALDQVECDKEKVMAYLDSVPERQKKLDFWFSLALFLWMITAMSSGLSIYFNGFGSLSLLTLALFTVNTGMIAYTVWLRQVFAGNNKALRERIHD